MQIDAELLKQAGCVATAVDRLNVVETTAESSRTKLATCVSQIHVSPPSASTAFAQTAAHCNGIGRVPGPVRRRLCNRFSRLIHSHAELLPVQALEAQFKSLTDTCVAYANESAQLRAHASRYALN
jgi:hypothetical protein